MKPTIESFTQAQLREEIVDLVDRACRWERSRFVAYADTVATSFDREGDKETADKIRARIREFTS